jgi:threonine/homoserine/homoserine lactone efflux protein
MHIVLACVVAFTFGFVGSIPLAGPIAVLMLSRAAQRRFGEAFRVGVGAALAEGTYSGVAFWGFNTFLARNSRVEPISQAAAALVLSTLGVAFMFWKPQATRDQQENAAGTVLLGFSVSALNPTLIITWSAAVAFLYSKGLGRGLPQLAAIPFGVSASAGIASEIACLIALLERYQGRVPQRVMTWIIRAMGLMLLGLGLWSGVQLWRWLTDRGSHRSPASSPLSLASCPTPPPRDVRLCPCSSIAITTSG